MDVTVKISRKSVINPFVYHFVTPGKVEIVVTIELLLNGFVSGPL